LRLPASHQIEDRYESLLAALDKVA